MRAALPQATGVIHHPRRMRPVKARAFVTQDNQRVFLIRNRRRVALLKHSRARAGKTGAE